MVTGGMKVNISLPSSEAEKLTPGILCLMPDWTISLEMPHPQT